MLSTYKYQYYHKIKKTLPKVYNNIRLIIIPNNDIIYLFFNKDRKNICNICHVNRPLRISDKFILSVNDTYFLLELVLTDIFVCPRLTVCYVYFCTYHSFQHKYINHEQARSHHRDLSYY